MHNPVRRQQNTQKIEAPILRIRPIEINEETRKPIWLYAPFKKEKTKKGSNDPI